MIEEDQSMPLRHKTTTRVFLMGGHLWTIKNSGSRASASTTLANGTKIELRTIEDLRRYFLTEITLCDFRVGTTVFRRMRDTGESLHSPELVTLYRSAVEAINQAREEIVADKQRDLSDQAAKQIKG
jgi:hypothetical protein